MKKFLIIYANPNNKSLCSTLRDKTIKILKNKECEVRESDLYAMKYNPVASPDDFKILKSKEYFNYLDEQVFAFNNNFINYKDYIREELDKINWADCLIFIFPIWWGSCPAILKGWIDKSMLYGHSWTEKNTFKNGLLRDKKAYLITTCDDIKESYSSDGVQGMNMDQMLNHINRNLSFTGMDVYKTYIIYQVSSITDHEKENQIRKFEDTFNNIEKMEILFNNSS